MRKGEHEGLIDFETFQTIQARLKGTARSPAHKDLNADFPRRGAVVGGHCNSPLTACWSKGRVSHHPYYLFPKRGCQSYEKSIRRADIEGEFEKLLKGMEPAPHIFQAPTRCSKNLRNNRLVSGEAQARLLKTELAKITKQVDQFLDRIADAATPSVIAAYETRIRKLEKQKIVLAEKIAQTGKPVRSFDATLRTAFEFLASPWRISCKPLESTRFGWT